MPKFDLKIVNERLVIDLNKMTDDYSESYGYDGLPNKYDIGELGAAPTFLTIEISDTQLEAILAEYESGGECGWCGEVRKELRGPHMMDFVPGEKMCRYCWNLDRGTYLGSMGEDIGPFDENDKSKPCVKCGRFLTDEEQLCLDDKKHPEMKDKVICENCVR